MPIGEFHDPEEVLDYVYDKLNDNKGELGLAHVAYSDESLLPEYPVAVVSAGTFGRILIGTHKFQLVFSLDIYVLHAKLSLTHKTRTQEDMALATSIKKLLDDDPTLNNNIIFGFCDGADPGVLTRPKGESVVGTRITWTGEGRQSFT